MTNQAILLLFAFPILCGLLLLWVMRSDRRRQFVEQRLHTITVGKGDSDPTPRLALHRRRRRAASRGAVFQFPRKFTASFDAALEATGKRIGLLHLISAGFIAAIV